MDTPLITILTPSYNRVNTLPKLFQSLYKQTYLNFEWLIIDDGSTDGTKELIQKYIASDPPFHINYIWQENAGKAKAINRAILEINSCFVYFMDSDDYLPEKAIDMALPYLKSIQNDDRFSGITGLRVYENGNPIGSIVPNPILDIDYLSFRYKYRATGDYAEIVKTTVLRKYMFPNFEGEKFCTEALVFNRISRNYISRYVNCPLRVTEYLPGGLTDTYDRAIQSSPNYSMLYYKELFYNKVPIAFKIKALCSYWDIMRKFNGQIEPEVKSTIAMELLGPIVLMLRWMYKLVR